MDSVRASGPEGVHGHGVKVKVGSVAGIKREGVIVEIGVGLLQLDPISVANGQGIVERVIGGEGDVGGSHRVNSAGTSTPWKGVEAVVEVPVEAGVSSVCRSGVCATVGSNTGKGIISMRHVERKRVRGGVGMGADIGYDFGAHASSVGVSEASDEIGVDGRRVGTGV